MIIRRRWIVMAVILVLLYFFMHVVLFSEPVERSFRSLLSDAEAATLRDVLAMFMEVAVQSNITYFMYGGTLLGSYRHHGRIPWDDDIDLLVPTTQKARLHRALESQGPAYVVNSSPKYRWKFYADNSSFVRHKRWKYPYVDISFYEEDREFVWDEDPTYRRFNTYAKSDVFPVCLRPFDGFLLPAPRNPLVFTRKVNIEVCATHKYDHRIERFIRGSKNVKCSALWDIWPFVFRTSLMRGTDETLRIGPMTLNSTFVTSSCGG